MTFSPRQGSAGWSPGTDSVVDGFLTYISNVEEHDNIVIEQKSDKKTKKKMEGQMVYFCEWILGTILKFSKMSLFLLLVLESV